jgi:hypothetical protein
LSTSAEAVRRFQVRSVKTVAQSFLTLMTVRFCFSASSSEISAPALRSADTPYEAKAAHPLNTSVADGEDADATVLVRAAVAGAGATRPLERYLVALPRSSR